MRILISFLFIFISFPVFAEVCNWKADFWDAGATEVLLGIGLLFCTVWAFKAIKKVLEI